MSDAGSEETPRARPAQAIDDFDASYRGTPPWDIGRPQPVFLGLAEAGLLQGPCPRCRLWHRRARPDGGGAVACRQPASTRRRGPSPRRSERRKSVGSTARFLVWDAAPRWTNWASTSTRFSTADCSMSSTTTVGPPTSRAWAPSLEPGGRLFLCCFSDRQPGDWGPRRVSEGDIRVAFESGWDVESIEAVQFVTNLDPPSPKPGSPRSRAADGQLISSSRRRCR